MFQKGHLCFKKIIPIINRILSKIKKDNISKCWIFLGAHNQYGYGLISRKGKTICVHRYTYWYYKIKPLGTSWKEFSESCSDLEVCHKCDNPPCCNPKHLFIGTHSTNIQDSMKKGRFIVPAYKGEKHGSHKLTENQVLKIYNMKGTLKEIANKFSISFQNVSSIKLRKTWCKVTGSIRGK